MPGVLKARNQADYHEGHLRRIRLIRTLTSVGGLDLSSVGELLGAVDDRTVELGEVLAAVNRALCPQREKPQHRLPPAPHAVEVEHYLDDLAWRRSPDSPAQEMLVQVVAALRGLGCSSDLHVLDILAQLADQLAVAELDLQPDVDQAEPDRGAVIARTVLLDVAFSMLHRLACEHHALTRFVGRSTDP